MNRAAAVVVALLPVGLVWLSRERKSAEVKTVAVRIQNESRAALTLSPPVTVLNTQSQPSPPDKKTGLRYFTPGEFGIWWSFMDPGFVALLDEFRHRLGTPVQISPADGSLGRVTGPQTSQHHVINAPLAVADVMPFVIEAGRRRGLTRAELSRAFNLAKEIGFTGVGIYPEWQPFPGLHLDLRPDRQAGNPATWAGVRNASGQQVYVAAGTVLA